MKLLKKLSWLMIVAMLCTMLPISNTKANTNEMDGIKIGTILYDIDENGNIVETVVDDSNTITEEEALKEYYEKFIGNGNISMINETTDSIEIITKDTVLKDITIEKDIYISKNTTLTVESTVTIKGNIYVFGSLKNTGNLEVTGSLYCLNYGEQKAGEYDYGTLINEEMATITCDNILVKEDYLESGIPVIYYLISIDDYGKETIVKGYTNYNESLSAYETIIKKNPNINYAVKSQDVYWKIKYGVVVFKKILSNGAIKNINITEDGNNTSGYINPSYGIDAAYLETKDDKVKFRIANVTAWANASLMDIVPYTDKTTYVNYYKVSDNKLYHHIRENSVDKSDTSGSYSGAGLIGPAPDYLKPAIAYYSYDGTYFYTDYFKMIDDYRSNTSTNAINKDKPYINYYQYLSHRTKTIYTFEQINEYVNYFLKKNYKDAASKMRDSGELFKNNESLYGSNALLMMGVAANESGWGRSSYAMNKNNLFGHAAYDHDPDNATGYASVNESIQYHAQIYISKNYASPTIRENNKVVLGSTYFSANLGDKGSGMNIRYASDPYWGEKNARFAYQVDEYFGNKDYGRYTIGMKNVVDAVNVRKEPNSTSTKLYVTENILDVPFIILDEVKGQRVNGSDIWYKIQSDAPLLADRSSYTTTNDTYRYDYVNSYAYIHSSYVDVVFEGSEEIDYSKDEVPEEKPEPPIEIKPYDIDAFIKKTNLTIENGMITNIKSQSTISKMIETLNKIDSEVKVEIDTNHHANNNDYISTDMILKINTPDEKTYAYTFIIKGDVNCDGKISSVDYVLVKNHILNITKIEGTMSKSADVNKDGYIKSVDYVLIKNHILNISEIK